MNDMGTFRISVEIDNPATPGERYNVHSVLVATGSELSWFPARALESLGIERHERRQFRLIDGTLVERSVGAAFVYVAGKRTTDDVVFGEGDDQSRLGARSLEGLNLLVDPVSRRLVDAGARTAAAGSF